jgi:transcriptional regulator GlxA family with amidase domain
MQIAILLYPQMTALDAIGPAEVLGRIPGAKLAWVASTPGPVRTDAGLTLIAEHALDTVLTPDIVLVPGGREDLAIATPAILDWLRAVHPQTRLTTSVCTGALVLGAADLLRNVRATTHWYGHKQLKGYGARPVRRRVVRDGRIMTAAGVSAGIDMALTLTRDITGPVVAKAIQLGIEYDPQPPFRSGSYARAGWLTRWLTRRAMGRYYRRSQVTGDRVTR